MHDRVGFEGFDKAALNPRPAIKVGYRFVKTPVEVYAATADNDECWAWQSRFVEAEPGLFFGRTVQVDEHASGQQDAPIALAARRIGVAFLCPRTGSRRDPGVHPDVELLAATVIREETPRECR
jgi:hypothetical protein